MKIKDIYDYLKSLYPLSLSAPFDQGKVGLQFGSVNDEVKKVIVTLDVTMEALDLAIKVGANLIISHHPFMFQPLVNLDYDTPFGEKLLKVFNNRINIMAFHTNYDCGNDGMNDALANVLGLKNIHMLEDEASPSTLIRIGEVDNLLVTDLIDLIKKQFMQEKVRVAGPIDKVVRHVAIVGGSGTSEFSTALHAGADVFITGQVPHHLGLEAIDYGMPIVEVSHAVEFIGVEALYQKLSTKFNCIEWVLNKSNYDPFNIL